MIILNIGFEPFLTVGNSCTFWVPLTIRTTLSLWRASRPLPVSEHTKPLEPFRTVHQTHPVCSYMSCLNCNSHHLVLLASNWRFFSVHCWLPPLTNSGDSGQLRWLSCTGRLTTATDRKQRTVRKHHSIQFSSASLVSLNGSHGDGWILAKILYKEKTEEASYHPVSWLIPC